MLECVLRADGSQNRLSDRDELTGAGVDERELPLDAQARARGRMKVDAHGSPCLDLNRHA